MSPSSSTVDFSSPTSHHDEPKQDPMISRMMPHRSLTNNGPRTNSAQACTYLIQTFSQKPLPRVTPLQPFCPTKQPTRQRLSTVPTHTRNPNNKMSSTAPTRYKLIFYVPPGGVEAVKAAVFETGAGEFPGGKYKHTCWETTGTGQFLPVKGAGAKPAIGELLADESAFRLERVEEVRCEILCIDRETTAKAVGALKRAHPYEEPAYEVYKLEDF
ncbi:unnamed protein product [Tuber aestivum]|uniref:ATP phosphoribosyltransferase n=1 Tax=Tuber aestivum TaxID=59557 RepID=A0A292PJN6_9PEZI|nr:unnamed protein product [Tuber aestivum]